MPRMPPILWTPAMLLLIAGCTETRDDRLVEFVRDSSRQQAEQNREMARLNHEVAEGARRLVEADSRSREELITLERELQAEQAEIGTQRDRLEEDRRTLAQERRRDAVLTAVLDRLGQVVLCGLPLVLCWYLLHGLRRDPAAEALDAALIEEPASEQPRVESALDGLLVERPRRTIQRRPR